MVSFIFFSHSICVSVCQSYCMMLTWRQFTSVFFLLFVSSMLIEWENMLFSFACSSSSSSSFSFLFVFLLEINNSMKSSFVLDHIWMLQCQHIVHSYCQVIKNCVIFALGISKANLKSVTANLIHFHNQPKFPFLYLLQAFFVVDSSRRVDDRMTMCVCVEK